MGPLEWLVATPHFHHWHHSNDPSTRDRNFAGQVPLVDWVFGTHLRPPGWPEAYGCDGHVAPSGYLAQLANPWTTSGTEPTQDQRAMLKAEAAARTGTDIRRPGVSLPG